MLAFVGRCQHPYRDLLESELTRCPQPRSPVEDDARGRRLERDLQPSRLDVGAQHAKGLVVDRRHEVGSRVLA